MTAILIYSKSNCPYCQRAKDLLIKKGATFEEIRVDNDPEQLKSMMELSGQRSVPQIFINNRHVGGFDQLTKLNQSGELEQLLKGNHSAS